MTIMINVCLQEQCYFSPIPLHDPSLVAIMQASTLRGLRSTCHFGEEIVSWGMVCRIVVHNVSQKEYIREVCT